MKYTRIYYPTPKMHVRHKPTQYSLTYCSDIHFERRRGSGEHSWQRALCLLPGNKLDTRGCTEQVRLVSCIRCQLSWTWCVYSVLSLLVCIISDDNFLNKYACIIIITSVGRIYLHFDMKRMKKNHLKGSS